MAGGGAGRKALDDVLGLIDAKAYRSVEDLRAFGETHDPRTALVLTPLAHVYRDTPSFVVFEQVPPVLPVWERCAEEMRAWGYSVWVGILSAEQYGVPQTRKRAILIARADGVEAAPPKPTHSAYYSKDPSRLDPDVEPWVSMAEALGWGMTDRPYPTVASGTERGGGTDPLAVGGSGARKIITDARERGAWVDERPATTVQRSGGDPLNVGAPTAERVTVAEAAALQSYPPGFAWDVEVPDAKGRLKPITKTKTFLQIGNAVPPLLAYRILEGFLS
jgi:DNA (cytosine-5)-methyltransferase 1